MSDQLVFNDALSTTGINPGITNLTGTVVVDPTTSTVQSGSISITAAGALGAQTYTNLTVAQTGVSNGVPVYTLTGSNTLTNVTIVYTGDLPTANNATITALGTGLPLATGSGAVVSTVACFVTGTLIRTALGETRVEDLAVGDLVLTASGQHRPIRWIGRRSYSGRFARNTPDLLPVTFKAGSIADAVPARDLSVSPKHAMFLDGLLIPAEHLVNGVSIIKAQSVDEIGYWHIELDSHDVLLAEGAPAESFIDDDSRGVFHNGAEFQALYPDAETVPAAFCAPRANEGYALERVRRALAERAGVPQTTRDAGALSGHLDKCDGTVLYGWARSEAFPDAPVCLDVIVDGELVGRTYASLLRADLLLAGIGTGRHAFEITLAAPLSRDRAHDIEVRRSSDGAMLSGRLHLEACERAIEQLAA